MAASRCGHVELALFEPKSWSSQTAIVSVEAPRARKRGVLSKPVVDRSHLVHVLRVGVDVVAEPQHQVGIVCDDIGQGRAARRVSETGTDGHAGTSRSDVPDVGPGGAVGIGGSVRMGPGVAEHRIRPTHGVGVAWAGAAERSAARPQLAIKSDARTAHAMRTGRLPWSVARVVPKVGLEPTRACTQRCLRPSRLPFRHFGAAFNRKRRWVAPSAGIGFPWEERADDGTELHVAVVGPACQGVRRPERHQRGSKIGALR